MLKRLRRKWITRGEFPNEWRRILVENVPYYLCLPAEDQARLEELIQIFSAEKWFEGVGGLKMTDEIKVTIAAQACILLLGREADIYPGVRTIIVYPRTYRAEGTEHRPEGTQIRTTEIRSGESWSYGTVVLSWDDVLHGTADMRDGQNVVLHEFAHQLDNEMGVEDGIPDLPSISRYETWARVFADEYRNLLRRLNRRRPDLFRTYGAKSPAEFFAVATELFFERPEALRAAYPDLYAQLQMFYDQDPAQLMRCVEEGDA
jgi:Mlc titration factor MtfA (ptsG expression regulator)